MDRRILARPERPRPPASLDHLEVDWENAPRGFAMTTPLLFFRANAPHKYLIFASLLAVSLLGCGNSCFVFVSNPGGGSLPPGTPTCSVGAPTTNIRVRIGSGSVPPQNDDRTRIEHIFLTVQGIEGSTSTDENVPNWQELAPNLVKSPVQLDLLGRGNVCGSSILDSAIIPADVYRQVRLDLLPDQPGASESSSGINSCGRAGIHCVVTSNGEVQRVSIGNTETRIRVRADEIEGGFFPAVPAFRSH